MSDDQNPYRAPGSDPSATNRPAMKSNGPPAPARVPARRGLDWVVRGVGFYTRSPGPWTGAMLTLFVINRVLLFVPLLGLIASRVLSPVFNGGLMIGCHRVDDGGAFRYADLFAAFNRPPASRLAGVGGLELAMFMVLAIIFGSVWVATGLPVDPSVDPSTLKLDPSQLMWPVLVLLPAIVLVLMLILFAPVLIVFHDMGVTDALGLSYRACARNLLPLLVWVLTAIAVGVLASVIVGALASVAGSDLIVALLLMVLGAVLGAIYMGSVYAAYADIFLRQGRREPMTRQTSS